MDSLDRVKKEFIESYDKLADSLFRHCIFKVSDREKAKDLVQETFLKTWEYLVKKGEISNLKAFLYKVANNLIIDYYRKAKSFSLDSLQESGFDPASFDNEKVIIQAEHTQVMKMMQNLEPKDREVIVMRFLNDLSPREIGEILEVSENVVSVRLNRAIKKLKGVLGEN